MISHSTLAPGTGTPPLAPAPLAPALTWASNPASDRCRRRLSAAVRAGCARGQRSQGPSPHPRDAGDLSIRPEAGCPVTSPDSNAIETTLREPVAAHRQTTTPPG